MYILYVIGRHIVQPIKAFTVYVKGQKTCHYLSAGCGIIASKEIFPTTIMMKLPQYLSLIILLKQPWTGWASKQRCDEIWWADLQKASQPWYDLIIARKHQKTIENLLKFVTDVTGAWPSQVSFLPLTWRGLCTVRRVQKLHSTRCILQDQGKRSNIFGDLGRVENFRFPIKGSHNKMLILM